jgi:cytochrome c-type biogenesis protein CcmH/NrfF
MSEIESLISSLASFLWGIPLLIVLIGGGVRKKKRVIKEKKRN